MTTLFPSDTPALVACREEFIRDGLNPNPSEKQPDWLPIHWFAVASDADFLAVQAWVEAGGDVDAQTQGGDTALHLAVWNRNPAQVDWLLALGASSNVCNAKGNTPMHQALRRTEWELAWALIQAGADWAIKDHKGVSTLGHAVDTLRFGSMQPMPPTPEGHVWDTMWNQPQQLWRSPQSNSVEKSLFDLLPDLWQSLLLEKWLSENLPVAEAPRSPKARM